MRDVGRAKTVAEAICDVEIVLVTPSPRMSAMNKRLFDIVVATCALLVTWPLMLLGAIATKLTSPGPAFHRSKRAGLGGRPFDMFKLRTMRLGADTPDRKITAAADDRVTSVGRLLRKFKIDELPQFWNVLRGDMSVVGPRPEDWDLVQEYYTPDQRRILDVRPGIASPVDVRWYPDLTYHDPPPEGVSMQDWYVARHLPIQVAEGLRYAEEQTAWLDLRVIAQTIFCVLARSWWLPKKRSPSADGRETS